MINNVTLVGRLTKDPVLKKTSTGTSVVNFSLACKKKYKKENEGEAEYIDCIAWGKLADNLCSYMHKGGTIGLVGYLQKRSYENKEGKKVYVTEVVAESIQYISTPKETNTEYTTNPSMMSKEEEYEIINSEVDLDHADNLPF